MPAGPDAETEQPSATLPLAEGSGAVGGTIGRYRVERALGAGGMGVVVEAYDPELGRRVAIKLLRDRGASVTLGERLRREAQALARVTHPNVVAVYDAGVADSPYLVMQLIEGKTLGAHLAEAKRSPREIISLFVQAARGLGAIHAAGLVHRDFKPSNALVDRDGVVHVSDLGLARIGELAGEPDAAGNLTSTITNAIVGTPAYMAPEQSEARDLTAACDQFSLCVALWEALFGARPFGGTTIDEVRARFRRPLPEPPSGVVEGSVIRALRRGLAIDPAARFASMTELIAALTPRSRAPWIAGGLGAIAIGGVIAFLATRGGGELPSPVQPPPAKRALAPDRKTAERLTTTEHCEEFPAFGPDGTIYYDAPVGRDTHLFALDPATGQSRAISNVRGWDLAPQPSPDGSRIAFLRKTDALMATHVGVIGKLDEAKRIAGGGSRPTWSPDGKYVWAGASKLYARYDATTGALDRKLELPKGAFPMMGIELADGRFVLLTRTGTATADGLALFPAGSTTSTWLIEASNDQAMEEVLALAPDGEAVFVSRLAPNNAPELVRVPLDGGKPAALEGGSAISARKKLTIRGHRLVWSDCVERIGLAALTLAADGTTKMLDLAHNPWVDGLPVSAPGSRDIYFVSYRTTAADVWRVARDGSNPTKIPLGKLEVDRVFVSNDGHQLAVVAGDGVFVAPVDGSREPRKLLPTDTEESNAAFSRDGKRLFVERADRNSRRIAVVPVAGGEPTWLLPAPSYAPAQSPTADTLAYLAADPTSPTTTVVPMLLDLTTRKTRRLTPDRPPYPYRDLRWSPDGTRVLAIRRDGELAEIEAATGKVLRTFDVGADQLVGATYVGDEIIVGRVTWSGDLWSIELR